MKLFKVYLIILFKTYIAGSDNDRPTICQKCGKGGLRRLKNYCIIHKMSVIKAQKKFAPPIGKSALAFVNLIWAWYRELDKRNLVWF